MVQTSSFWLDDDDEIAYFTVRWKTRASFVYRTMRASTLTTSPFYNWVDFFVYLTFLWLTNESIVVHVWHQPQSHITFVCEFWVVYDILSI